MREQLKEREARGGRNTAGKFIAPVQGERIGLISGPSLILADLNSWLHSAESEMSIIWEVRTLC